MMAVGLRGVNLPTQIEADFLVAFLERNFAGHTIQELALAFEMAVARKLELRSEDVICYENFSVEYVARIMAAYRAWASKQMTTVEAEEEKRREASQRDKHQAKWRRWQTDYEFMIVAVTRYHRQQFLTPLKPSYATETRQSRQRRIDTARYTWERRFEIIAARFEGNTPDVRG